MILTLKLSIDDTRKVLEALSSFPMNKVRPLVENIEAQANKQLSEKTEDSKKPEAEKQAS